MFRPYKVYSRSTRSKPLILADLSTVLNGLLLIIATLWAGNGSAQTPDGWSWSASLATSKVEFATAVAVDPSDGSVYTVGQVERAYQGLGGLWVLIFGGNTGQDGYLVKQAADGTVQWSIAMGGTGDDACTGVCVGPTGLVYVTGYFAGNNASFRGIGGSAQTMNSAGSTDLFVVCYDANGNFQWKMRGGSTGADQGNSICHGDGKVFIGGSFTGTPVMAGLSTSPTAIPVTIQHGVVLALQDADGTGVWRVDGSNTISSKFIDVACEGSSVFFMGEHKGTAYTYSNASGSINSVLSTPAGYGLSGDIVVMSTAGSFLWTRSIANPSSDNIRAMAIAGSSDAIYVGGSTHNLTIFPGNVVQNAAGSPHDFAYVARIDRASGVTQWVRTMPSPMGNDHKQVVNDLSLDDHGELLVTGQYREAIEFPDGQVLTGEEDEDIQLFVSKFSSSGNVKWALTATGEGDDIAYGVANDGNGAIYIVGSFREEVTFNVEWDEHSSQNFFTARLNDLDHEVSGMRDPSVWNAFGPLCSTSGTVALSGQLITERSGPAVAVYSSMGIASNPPDGPTSVLGLYPGGVAVFDNVNDQIVIDLGDTILANEWAMVRWSSSGGTAQMNVQVSLSGGSGFTALSPITTTSTSLVFATITTTVPFRFLKLTRAGTATCKVDGVFHDLGSSPYGTWSGSGVSGNTFDPSGLSGPINITYTVEGQSTTHAITVDLPSVAGSVSGGGVICPGTNTTLSLTGQVGSTIDWSTSTDGGSTWNVVASNTTSYTLVSPPILTKVKTITTNGTCPSMPSNIVTVTPQDLTAPILGPCPANINANVGPGQCAAIVSYSLPTATDNCGGVVTVAPVNSAYASGSSFPIGTTNVQLIATDAAGNTSTCSFNITVVDSHPPVLSGCMNSVIVIENAESACGALAPVVSITASDNCGGALTPTLVVGPAIGSIIPLGNTLFTWSASYGGLTGTCSYTVTVIDSAPPMFSLGAPPIAYLDENFQAALPDLFPFLEELNDCSGIGVHSQVPEVGTMIDGATLATIHVADMLGNDTLAQFLVSVQDTISPTLLCSGTIEALIPIGACSTQVFIPTPVVNDNSGAILLFDSLNGIGSGSWFTAGNHLVTYMVSDPSGNPASCSTTVIVIGSPAPVLAYASASLCDNGPPLSPSEMTPLGGTLFCADNALSLDLTIGVIDPSSSSPGSYQIVYAFTGECPVSTVFDMEINAAPDAGSDGSIIICSLADPVMMLDSIGGSPDAGGTWSGTSPCDGSFDPNTMNAGIYMYTVPGMGSCADATASVAVSIVTAPNAGISGTLATCSTAGAIDLDAALGGSPDAGGQWYAADGTPSEPLLETAATGSIYTYVVQGTSACYNDSATIMIIVNTPDQLTAFDAGLDRTLDLVSNAPLDGIADGATSTLWSILSGAGAIAAPEQLHTEVHQLSFGTNLILFSAQVGACPTMSDTVSIIVNDLFIPQGFSPNGDGVNDRFEVIGLPAFPDNELTVFDRWGQVVYHAMGYANEWDGRGDNGEELVDDTYFMVFKLTLEERRNGYIIIKR